MFDLFLTGPYAPFSVALSLLFALLALELVFALLGGSLLGAGSDATDGPAFGTDLPEVADLDLDLGDLDVEAADLELAGFDDIEVPSGASTAASGGGLATWLGIGRMPLLIWLASLLFAFGTSGLAIQSVVSNAFGFALPAALASAPAAAAALWFTSRFGAVFARLVPKTETQSVSERHLGRRSGVITQGTAARGRPAEVRVTDRYGNTHYLRAEPLRDETEIAQGTEVLVLRHRLQGGYLLVPLSA